MSEIPTCDCACGYLGLRVIAGFDGILRSTQNQRHASMHGFLNIPVRQQFLEVCDCAGWHMQEQVVQFFFRSTCGR